MMLYTYNRIGIIDIYSKIVKDTSGEEIRVYISEIGILERSDIRKKYGTEAMLLLLDYAFDKLGLENVYASINENNIRSRKFHENLGFCESETVFKPKITPKGSKLHTISKEVWKDKREEILKILSR